MADRDPVIVSATRTPTGRFLGGLAPLSATDLGALIIKSAVERAKLPTDRLDRIDEVIMGNVVSAGEGQAPARQAALRAGLPDSIPAVTVNKVCGSGLKAVMLAAQAIKAGDGDLYVAGGMESMSNAPYLLAQARTGYRMGNAEMIDSVVHDGLWCAFENVHMGEEAEIVAEKYAVSRSEQDEFAYRSHMKAQEATEAGRFHDELTPVEIKGKKGVTVIDRDEPIRADTTLDALSALKPAFRKQNGTVTAGNAPGLSDGASATVVTSEQLAHEWDLPILARITGYAAAAITPKYIFACPPLAVNKLLKRTGMKMSDFDVIEVNEAFAAQALANGKELDWNWSRVNPNGGAVALGHPIGSSGSRVLTTLIYELRRRGGGRGLATLCLGGGGAVAMSVEVVG
ncbi:MAG: acetyl-CoA C-acetyltransferase [Ktedonobacterales bacterium]